jgi:peptide/nickel transport system permease protein
MLVYLIRRVMQSGIVLVVMGALVFVSIYVVGNPVDVLISPDATQRERAEAIVRLGMDRPLIEQFFNFVGNAVTGDFGRSFVHGVPATELILARLPATLELAFATMLIAISFGIPLGLWAGLRPNSVAGKIIMAGSILGFSLPTFWVGLLLMMLFAVHLGWLPAGGRGPTVEVLGIPVSFLTSQGLAHLALPALNLALLKLSLAIRLARANTREVALQDYIKFARAKGLSRTRVVTHHILKNIMISIVTVLGMELGSVIAFAAVTETIFSWPGIGKLLLDSILLLDRPVVVAYLMMTVLIFVTINLVVDLLYSFLDPRIRISESRG